jgi:Stigma-specific protein, Stig1
MEHRFDQLAKALAEGVSRREALQRMGSALAGALLASVGLGTAWGQSNDVRPFCGRFCREKFPPGPRRMSCVSACEACGGDVGRLCPSSQSDNVACCPTESAGCCDGICTDTQSNPYSCGRCGTVCPADAPVCCSGYCVNTKSDRDNCGACGNTCFIGVCCSGVCKDTINDPQNCGACGNQCSSDLCCAGKCCGRGQVCCGGVCCDRNACRNGVCTTSTVCRRDSDCRLFSDYCEGCNCRALLATQPDPPCDGQIYNCLVDPCRGHVAVCDQSTGKCLVR